LGIRIEKINDNEKNAREEIRKKFQNLKKVEEEREKLRVI